MRGTAEPLGRRWRDAIALALLALVPLAVSAQAKPAEPTGVIYTCIDDKGHRLTADRPIAECAGKEQRVLNRDGSLKTIQPPTLTAEERAEKEARDRRAAEMRAAQADAVRRDRNLIARFPNEEVHNRAREAALDTVRMAMRTSEQRVQDLESERKPLAEESEFYKGRQLPLKLRQALDANDAATDAQRSAMANQQTELVRINKLYDAELERLRRLWAGAPPGTLGPIDSAAATTPAPR